MTEHQPQLERIEQLLREGNELRRQAVSMQREALELQRSVMDEQRANLAKAAQINEQAMLLQHRARRMQAAVSFVAVPLLAVIVFYIGYLLFFRPL